MEKTTLSSNSFIARCKLKKAGYKKISKNVANDLYNTGKEVVILFQVDNWFDTTTAKYKPENPMSFDYYLYELVYYLADNILGYYVEKEKKQCC